MVLSTFQNLAYTISLEDRFENNGYITETEEIIINGDNYGEGTVKYVPSEMSKSGLELIVLETTYFKQNPKDDPAFTEEEIETYSIL